MGSCNSIDCNLFHLGNVQFFKFIEVPVGKEAKEDKENNCLVFILSGKLTVRRAMESDVTCEEDELFLLEQGVSYEFVVEQPARLVLFSFDSSMQICKMMWSDQSRYLLDSEASQLHPIAIKRPMKIVLDTILFYFKESVNTCYWQKAKQLELVSVFLNYYTAEEIYRLFRPLIHKNIGFYSKVLAHSTKAKNVRELAKLCGYSLTTFYKLFNEHFQGTSPYKWMLQQNAPLIKRRLLDADIPIKTIVSEFGFIDQSHLNRYCKRFLGGTPFQIRKKVVD